MKHNLGENVKLIKKCIATAVGVKKMDELLAKQAGWRIVRE